MRKMAIYTVKTESRKRSRIRCAKEKLVTRELHLEKETVEVKPQSSPPIVDVFSPEPQKPDDFVLETSLSGSSDFKLIHGSDVPTLEHLVELISRRHELNQNQGIVRVKVKIGQRICHINLDEPRDWKYISGLVVENGKRAELVFEVS
jgi:hypothetical protein